MNDLEILLILPLVKKSISITISVSYIVNIYEDSQWHWLFEIAKQKIPKNPQCHKYVRVWIRFVDSDQPSLSNPFLIIRDTKEIPERGTSNVSAGLGISTSVEATGESSFTPTKTVPVAMAVVAVVAIVAIVAAVVVVAIVAVV